MGLGGLLPPVLQIELLAVLVLAGGDSNVADLPGITRAVRDLHWGEQIPSRFPVDSGPPARARSG